MPVYPYRCNQCNKHIDQRFTFAEYERAALIECECGGLLQRIMGNFSFHSSLPDHFNHSLGRYVSNSRDFRDGLKRQSEQATLRTGIPHDYSPIDMRDKEALGVTDEGLESTARAEFEAAK